MKTIVGVRFRKPGKVYFFDPGYIQLNLKDKVVVETTMGEDVGEVVINKRQIPDDKVSTELKRIVRLANNRDLKRVEAYWIIFAKRHGRMDFPPRFVKFVQQLACVLHPPSMDICHVFLI